MAFCQDCDVLLTAEELHYYEYRCEGCERAWADRMAAWRQGAVDPELDQMFSGPARTIN